MAKVRSPNFPVVDLANAIVLVAKIYAREGRGKFPQLSAAAHLGYTSINGRSLGIFAALRAYGLLEGRGDDLIVTPDAIALIEAPADSFDRAAALTKAFAGPPMFNRIQEQYPEPPSEQTLRWWLIQQGFTPDGAEKAAQIFLESRKLVSLPPPDNQPVAAEPGDDERGSQYPEWVRDSLNRMLPNPGAKEKGLSGKWPEKPETPNPLPISFNERVLQSGMLSKTASYRVIVSGHVGEKEFDRLLKKLEMDKEILADAEPQAEPQSETRYPDLWDEQK